MSTKTSRPGRAAGSEVRPEEGCRMILFVAGREANSEQARQNLARLRSEGEWCPLEEVDVLEDYETALRYNVLVTPCLVVVGGGSQVTVVGTLREMEKVKQALGRA